MISNYKKAYSEVVGFLNCLPIEEYIKIPRDVIEFYEWNMDYTYCFVFDSTKTIDEQNISKEARAIILKIFMDYFASDEKKKEIKEILNKNELIHQKELRIKFNPYNLFNNTEKQVKNEEKNYK